MSQAESHEMDMFLRKPFAMQGDIEAVPVELQVNGAVSFHEGWPYDYERDQSTDPQAKNISRPGMNYLFGLITTLLRTWQTQGIYRFITADDNAGSAYTYPRAAYCRYDAGDGMAVWESLVDGNTATPGTDPTKWHKVGDVDLSGFVSKDLVINTTAPLKGGQALNGTITLSLNGASIPTPSTAMLRDAKGNSQVAAPVAAADIARKDTVDAAFAGAAPKAHAVSTTIHGRATSTLYGHAMASSVAPLAAGVAAVGDDDGTYARGKHVHPAQTTISGNAGSATKLQTPRDITVNDNATAAGKFDGAANVSVGVPVTVAAGTAANTLPATSTIALRVWLTTARNCLAWLVGRFNTAGQALVAVDATKLQTTRDIAANDNATAAGKFNGAANVSIGVPVTVAAGTAASTLPATSTIALRVWLTTARNCLAWLVGRFDASGQALAAVTATKWAIKRNFKLVGHATGNVDMDGSANTSLTVNVTDVRVTNDSGLTLRGQGLIGKALVLADATSLDDLFENAAYFAGPAHISVPDNTSSWLIIVERVNGTVGTTSASVYQTAYKYASGHDTYQRVRYTTGGWTPWRRPKASTAELLQTARKIGGVSFSGGADINLPGVNAKGNQDTTGNAATASKLEAARNIFVSGAAVMANKTSWDGSGPCELRVTGLNASYITSGTVPDIARLGMAHNTGANGYVKLPGGLIFQWGTSAAVGYDTSVTLTFPLAFPNACRCVMATAKNATANDDDVFPRVMSFTATTVTIKSEKGAGTGLYGTRYMSYFAIGR